MATIATDQDVTLVNVFTVSPERQRELADLLVEATNGPPVWPAPPEDR